MKIKIKQSWKINLINQKLKKIFKFKTPIPILPETSERNFKTKNSNKEIKPIILFKITTTM